MITRSGFSIPLIAIQIAKSVSKIIQLGMPTFTHHSAKAVISPKDVNGLQEVFFTGLIDARSFACLQSRVMRHLSGTRAVVLRYDHAALMLSESQPIDASAYENAPVLAAVVKAAFLPMASQYAAKLGRLGVIAAVFSDSSAQIALAHQWAARHMLASRSKSPV